MSYLVLISSLFVCGMCHQESTDHAAPHKHGDSHYDSHGDHNSHFDHVAVLGSRKLDSKFEEMTVEESKRQLGMLVDKMDVDQDGIVSLSELRIWILNSFRSIDREEAIEQMVAHDLDHDGNLTWSEYTDRVYGYQPDEIIKLAYDTNPQVLALSQMIALDLEKFLAADTNADGTLDVAEYCTFLHPHDFTHMHATEIQRILRDYDKNHDDLIELSEYMQEEDFPQERNPEQDIIDQENFNDYDRNMNGFLDADEIRYWALPNHNEAAEDEALHLIQETDLDRDGALNKAEILTNHQMWVGSEVTDYGRALRDEL